MSAQHTIIHRLGVRYRVWGKAPGTGAPVPLGTLSADSPLAALVAAVRAGWLATPDGARAARVA